MNKNQSLGVIVIILVICIGIGYLWRGNTTRDATNEKVDKEQELDKEDSSQVNPECLEISRLVVLLT